jgi:DNA-binding NarL/FixJ family response regulator
MLQPLDSPSVASDPESLSIIEPAAVLSAVIVDDDPLVRRVVRDTLERAGILVLAEGADGWEGVELARRHHPDVVLMDVVMPRLDGIAATRRIVEENPDQAVIILTGTADDEVGVLGLRAGATGFLTKDLRIEALPRAIEGVQSGEVAVSRRMTMRLIEHLRRTPDTDGSGVRPVRSPLTDREWEVVDLIDRGHTNEDIARELVLAVETVRSHVKNLRRKLGAPTREQAAARARELRGPGPHH